MVFIKTKILEDNANLDVCFEYRIATLWVKKSSLSDHKLPLVTLNLPKYFLILKKLAKTILTKHLKLNKINFYEQNIKPD